MEDDLKMMTLRRKGATLPNNIPPCRSELRQEIVFDKKNDVKSLDTTFV